MTLVGSALASIALFALCLGLAPRSAVSRRLELVAPGGTRDRSMWHALLSSGRVPAGVSLTTEQIFAAKISSACAAGLTMGLLSLAVPIGPLVVLAGAYLGWLGPSLVIAAHARAEMAQAERASVVLVERLGALVAAGRPPETALASLLARPSGSSLLDRMAERVQAAYVLGAPLFRTLATAAREDALATCAEVAEDLERARDLGTGSGPLLRERRSALRQQERSRALEAASTVEGKLMLVLVLCYLPALMLLVVIPLFMSLLRGLGT